MANSGFKSVLIVACAFVGLSATVAGAAPQSLALVATGTPVELKCDGNGCSAEFSAFCLQLDRSSPNPETPYLLTAKSSIVVKATTIDGREISLAAHQDLRFRAPRGYTAIRIELAPGVMKRHRLTQVRVDIDENATLAPKVVPGDDNPVSKEELATVEDALRPLGSTLVDQNSERMAAARVTNRMINLLPRINSDPAIAKRQWHLMISKARQGGLSAMATRYAQNAYDLCEFYAERSISRDLRRCMQGQHDSLIHFLNADYWKAIETGS